MFMIFYNVQSSYTEHCTHVYIPHILSLSAKVATIHIHGLLLPFSVIASREPVSRAPCSGLGTVPIMDCTGSVLWTSLEKVWFHNSNSYGSGFGLFGLHSPTTIILCQYVSLWICCDQQTGQLVSARFKIWQLTWWSFGPMKFKSRSLFGDIHWAASTSIGPNDCN